LFYELTEDYNLRRALYMSKAFRNYQFKTVKELLICGATEVASGKERKYVWNSIDPDVNELREGILDTFCAIHETEEDSDQIKVGNDFFEVSQYEIPTEVWLAKILNYSRRVALSERAFSKNKKVYTKTLDNPYNKENVLSPTGLKNALKIFAEYKKFDTTEGVSKELRKLTEYEGVFTVSEDYMEVLNEEKITYDLDFVNCLQITLPKVAGFGEFVEPSTKEVSIKALVGVEGNGNQTNNTTGDGGANQ
jgi:hypothetical protein